MSIHNITSRTDVLSYVRGLCNKPYQVQLKEAQERIQSLTPCDYPVATHEDRIIDNAPEIAKILRTYEEKANGCPTAVLDTLKLEFGKRVIELVGE